ncbi:MAG: amidohydrolase family protein [Burkholderiales bacterium]|nr:amidohydrolase family protein [Burkholderiales bacterium]
MVWGSDSPWTGFEGDNDYRKLREGLSDWVDGGIERAVLWDNAARLYGFQ